jgi:hypothetical protein
MDQLQKLHRKFHISEPTYAQLEVTIRVFTRNMLFYALSHLSHVIDEGRFLGNAPGSLSGHGNKARSYIATPCSGPRL